MNAMVAFRSNALGNLAPNRVQRESAAKSVAANFTAKYNGAKVQTASGTRAKSAVTGAKSAAKSDSSSDATETASSSELDKDTFLQLLVTQMQNQDPLEPVDNSEMVAQLAQFSSLEQMTNLNESFEGMNDSFNVLAGNVDQLNFISAQGLLGQYVEGLNTAGEVVTGEVQSVGLDGSIVMLEVDGEIVPMTYVYRVGESAVESTSSEEAS